MRTLHPRSRGPSGPLERPRPLERIGAALGSPKTSTLRGTRVSTSVAGVLSPVEQSSQFSPPCDADVMQRPGALSRSAFYIKLRRLQLLQDCRRTPPKSGSATMRAQRWPRATAIAVALLATTATCQTDLITRPAKPRELAREDCVGSDIRIVEGLKGNVTTSTGLHCIPPVDCTARIDGVVWDATNYPHKIDELVSKQREKREAHPNAIFIAFSHEAYSHLWNRKIGNSKSTISSDR